MENFFDSKENQELYVGYYNELHSVIEDYLDMLKIEINKHFNNPSKIISIRSAHLGFQGFVRCMYRLTYERPNYFNVKNFVEDENGVEDEMHRMNVILNVESFVENLPGIDAPMRPPMLNVWLSAKIKE